MVNNPADVSELAVNDWAWVLVGDCAKPMLEFGSPHASGS
jgi:hypothetical protein